MTRHDASPYATVMDDSQLTGRPIVIPGAGHLLNLEAPDAVNAAILTHWERT